MVKTSLKDSSRKWPYQEDNQFIYAPLL